MSFQNSLAVFFALTLIVGCKSRRDTGEVRRDGLRESVAVLVDSVAADNVLTTRSAARRPGVLPEYRRREALIAAAETEELLRLFELDDTVLRLIGFEGLCRRGYGDTDRLFGEMLGDNSTVQFIRGDIVEIIPALQYAYMYTLREEIPGIDAGAVPEGPAGCSVSPELLREARDRIAAYGNLRGVR